MPSDRGTEISVIIPSHQRRVLVLRVLEALAAQSLDLHRFEVVVVCDGCSDGTAEAIRNARTGALAGTTLEIIEQERSGAATARNRGARVSRSPLLLFLDDDMFAEPDLLEIHLRRHAENPGTIVLGAIPVHPDSPRSFITRGLHRWAERRHELFSATTSAIPVTEVLTGHMSMARETFESLGGFDTRFTAGGSFGGEDIEFAWRAREKGLPVVYEPKAITHQFYAKTFLSLTRNIRDAARADVALAEKHEEMRSFLPLGKIQSLPVGQRALLRATLAMPYTSRVVLAPLLVFLELASRLRLSGTFFEMFHALCRAHLYGLGMRDARVSPAAPAHGSSRPVKS